MATINLRRWIQTLIIVSVFVIGAYLPSSVQSVPGVYCSYLPGGLLWVIEAEEE